MNVLVTGGGGFIGRWVVGKLLSMGCQVTVLDNFSSGSPKNLYEYRHNPALNIVCGDLLSDKILRRALLLKPDIVFHLAARINVQHSIDQPRDTFNTDVLGTFRLLEAVRPMRPHFVMVSTCMVFGPMDEVVGAGIGISEAHPVKPASPYAGAKLAAEHLVESYARTYALPATILRPFNTYGPFQRIDGEGGVIAIFLDRVMHHQNLLVYGDGLQTRDFLYVEDCADFIVRAGLSPASAHAGARIGGGDASSDRAPFSLLVGGSGIEIRIIDLACIIAGNAVAVENVAHIHPQSEIKRLLCDSAKARAFLGWQPQVSLTEGIERTRIWLRERMNE